MNKSVNAYFTDGCGRCKYGGTPDCKVHLWTKELQVLRGILQDSDLNEEVKWGVPTYTFNSKNVLQLVAFKDFAAIAFFKGSLLKDVMRILKSPGPNSQASKRMEITNVDQITEFEASLRSFIKQAIQLEKEGRSVSFKKQPEAMPEELLQKFELQADLKKAFEALTPGKQRGYILHISAAKQSSTRISRIEKCIPKILKGKGFHDR